MPTDWTHGTWELPNETLWTLRSEGATEDELSGEAGRQERRTPHDSLVGKCRERADPCGQEVGGWWPEAGGDSLGRGGPGGVGAPAHCSCLPLALSSYETRRQPSFPRPYFLSPVAEGRHNGWPGMQTHLTARVSSGATVCPHRKRCCLGLFAAQAGAPRGEAAVRRTDGVGVGVGGPKPCRRAGPWL